MADVLIFEVSGSPHEKGLASLAEVLVNIDLSVELVTSAKNYSRLTDEHKSLFKSVFVKNPISALFFAYQHRKRFVSVIHNTVSVRSSLLTFFVSIVSARNIYYVRNANSWLEYSWNKSFWKHRLLAMVSTAIKKRLLSNAYLLLVEKFTIQQYLLNKQDVPVEVIPFGLGRVKFKEKIKSVVLTLVVPGVIDGGRKNNHELCEAIGKIPVAQRRNIKLVLLGKPKTKADLINCEVWRKTLGASFEYFDEFIPNDVFDRVTMEASAVICSHNVQHECEHLSEIYGTSKGSAVDAHAFSNGLPLIVNEAYQVDQCLHDSTLKFRDADHLAELLIGLVYKQTALSKLQQAAQVTSDCYSLGNVSAKLVFLKRLRLH